jgi:predicted nucleotidyltransferase
MTEVRVTASAGVPADVARALEEFLGAARAAFGDHLESVVLHGSAAEGALRATSDVNVIVVLRAFDGERAARVREAARLAHATVRLRAMFLLVEEVPDAAEAFAQKFDDVRRRHRVLWGRDAFAALTPSRAALVARVNQVLLNLTLRLRAAYVERALHEEQLVAVVADAAPPLRTAAASLLELQGRGTVSPKAALQELAGAVVGPTAETTLRRLSEARETGALPAGVAGDTLLELIALARGLRTRLRALG